MNKNRVVSKSKLADTTPHCTCRNHHELTLVYDYYTNMFN